MTPAPQKSPGCMPPRRPLCRTCDDTGEVRVPGAIYGDACPDCTRNAEMRWLGAGIRRDIVPTTVPTIVKQEPENDQSHG